MKARKVLNALAYALVIGVICGAAGTAFNYIITYTLKLRAALPFYVQLALMVALGPAIAACYGWFGASDFKGTDGVVQAARDGQEFSLKVSPAAALGLILTCLAESAGCKEGGSFQIGAPIAHWIGRKLGIEAPPRRLLTMCAIAAGFASVLGTPLFGAVIAAEVAFNRLEYKYLPYTAVSSAVAYLTNLSFKAVRLRYGIDFSVKLDVMTVLKLLLIAALAGALGRLFLHIMVWTGKLMGKIEDPYIRILTGGIIASVILILLKTQVHLSGGNLIPQAISGTLNWYDFLLKMFFLAFLCKSGYKTGLLPQNLVIGGTFGGVMAVLGADPGLCTAAGIIGMAAGVSGCPIAMLFLGLDLFGISLKTLLLCAAFALLGAVCSGRHAYYSVNKAPEPEAAKDQARDPAA